MKSSIKSSILKRTTVEIVSPVLVEGPNLEIIYSKQVPVQEYSGEIAVLTLSNEESDIIVQAKAEANRIISEARAKAEAILLSAQNDSETMKKTVEESVRSEILPLARAEGYDKGIKEAEEEAGRIRKQASEYLNFAQKALRDEFNRVDKDLINLCIKISERILHATLTVEPTKLLSIIRNLTLLPKERKNIKIYLSNEDWEWYQRLPPENVPPYQVVIDESLKAGDTFLECEEGVFDAGIDSQLGKIEQYLLEESENGRLDSASQKD